MLKTSTNEKEEENSYKAKTIIHSTKIFKIRTQVLSARLKTKDYFIQVEKKKVLGDTLPYKSNTTDIPNLMCLCVERVS